MATKKNESEGESSEDRVARYKTYGAETLARMCVETEDAYEDQDKRYIKKLARLTEKNRRLVAALQEARTGFHGHQNKAEEHAGYVDDALKANRGK